MAVIRVLVQAQIAHHHGVVAELGAERGDRLLADARRVPGLGPLGVLAHRHPEQHERANAGLGDLDRLLAQRFERVLELAGHGGDGDRLVDAFLGEERRDQIAGVERGLSDQRSERGCPPEPPGTRRGVAHDLRVPGRARQEPARRSRGEDALERRDHAVDRVGIRHGGHGQPVGSRLLRRHRPDAHHLGVALHRAERPDEPAHGGGAGERDGVDRCPCAAPRVPRRAGCAASACGRRPRAWGSSPWRPARPPAPPARCRRVHTAPALRLAGTRAPGPRW